MKRPYLFCLVMCCLLFSGSYSFATEFYSLDWRTPMKPIDDYWGEDVVIAAVYAYGWQRKSYANFEGTMFPLYLGYISFDDSGEQKMVYFTSSNQASTMYVESIFESINLHRGSSYVQWFSPIDGPQFCSGVFYTLRNLNILEAIRLPLGTAQNYDFSFKEQTEFRLEEAEVLSRQRAFAKFPEEWGISKENLIMTPKQ